VKEIIYKGATRPAMIWGIPLPAFIVLISAAFLLCVWGIHIVGLWIVPSVAVPLVPLALWARLATRRDDQRLHQVLLRARLRAGRPRSPIWGSTRSYTPICYRGTRDAWRG